MLEPIVETWPDSSHSDGHIYAFSVFFYDYVDLHNSAYSWAEFFFEGIFVISLVVSCTLVGNSMWNDGLN